MSADSGSIESLFHLACQQPADSREGWVASQLQWPDTARSTVIGLLRAESSLGRLGRRLSGEVPRGSRLGAYELVAPLGHGACGEVHLSRRVEPPQWLVAIKVARSVAPEILLRIASERAALSRVDHPGIARLVDFGELSDGRPWIATDYVPGATVTDYVAATEASTVERVRLVAEACDALMHAHARSLVHRDVKPRNLLIDARGERPRPVLIDFGLAKSMGEPLLDGDQQTELGAVLGTPEFMAPEQACGALATVKMDVFSMGCLLGAVLTGRAPRRIEELRATGLPLHLAIGRVPVELPSKSQRALADPRHNKLLWHRLDSILVRAVAADQSSRQGSIRDLRDDLLDLLRIDSSAIDRSWLDSAADRRWRGIAVATALSIAVTAAIASMLFRTGSSAPGDVLDEASQPVDSHITQTDLAFALDDSELAPPSSATVPPGHTLSSRLNALVLSRLNQQSPSRESDSQFAQRVQGLILDAQAQGESPDASAYLMLAGVLYAGSRHRDSIDAASRASALNDRQDRVIAAEAELIKASALSMLREDELATSAAQSALTLVRAAFPAGARERIEREASCWRVLRRAGPIRAADALQELVSVATISFGADDRLTVEVEQARAAALAMTGREDIALQPNRDAYAKAHRLLGDRDPVTLSAAASLMLILGYSSRPDEAIELSQVMLPLARERLGADSSVALNMALNTAEYMRQVGRTNEAAAIFRDTYARYCRLFDRGHLLAVHVEERLIRTLLELGNDEECIERLGYHLSAPVDPRDVSRKERLRSQFSEVILKAKL